jgi:hypothetical protein
MIYQNDMLYGKLSYGDENRGSEGMLLASSCWPEVKQLSNSISCNCIISGYQPELEASSRFRSITRFPYFPCSSRNFSTSMAAAQPEPAAVMAWR